MKKSVTAALLVVVLTILISGGYYIFKPVEDEKDGSASVYSGLQPVSAEVVKNVQNTRVTERADIYTPIIEQWEGSAHAKSADSPETTGHDAPYCYPCHSAEYIYYEGDQRPNHTTMKLGVTCIMCHKMDAAGFVLSEDDRIKLCTQCHTATGGGPLEPGGEAHHGQAEIYGGEGAIGIAVTPNPKVQKGLACSDCHMPNQNHDFKSLTPDEAKKENRQTICFMCHKDEDRQEFAKNIASLQKDVGSRKDKLLEGLGEVKEKLDKAKESQKDVGAIEKEYGIAFTNVTIVDSDKSKGVHNPKYTLLILEDAEKRLASIKAKLN